MGERSSPEDEDLVSMGGGDDWPSGAARKEGHGDGGSRVASVVGAPGAVKQLYV